MKQKYIWLLIVLFAIAAYIYNQQTITPDAKTFKSYPNASNFDFHSIQEIIQNNFTSGQYNTNGYVVYIYRCPPCPKGAQCKTCRIPHIAISEENNMVRTQGNNMAITQGKTIIIPFTNTSINLNQFEIDKKYEFSLSIANRKINLIGYNLIE